MGWQRLRHNRPSIVASGSVVFDGSCWWSNQSTFCGRQVEFKREVQCASAALCAMWWSSLAASTLDRSVSSVGAQSRAHRAALSLTWLLIKYPLHVMLKSRTKLRSENIIYIRCAMPREYAWSPPFVGSFREQFSGARSWIDVRQQLMPTCFSQLTLKCVGLENKEPPRLVQVPIIESSSSIKLIRCLSTLIWRTSQQKSNQRILSGSQVFFHRASQGLGNALRKNTMVEQCCWNVIVVAVLPIQYYKPYASTPMTQESRRVSAKCT